MKMNGSFVGRAGRSTRWTALAVLGFCLAGSALAVLPPREAALPNFDMRRERAPKGPAVSADQQAAVARLQAAVREVRVDFDPLLGAPKYVRAMDGFLSGPNAQGRLISPAAAQAIPAGDPHRAIRAFLNDHADLFGHGAEALTGARAKRDYVDAHNQLRTAVWEQQLDGIPLFQSVLMGHITKNGELVSLASLFLPDLAASADAGTPGRAGFQAAPPVSVAQAIQKAAQNIGQAIALNDVVAAGGPVGDGSYLVFRTPEEAYVRLAWLPLHRRALRLSWEVMVSSHATQERYWVVIDAQTGEALKRVSLTRHISPATYNVFTRQSPAPWSPIPCVVTTTQPPLTNRVMVTIDALSTNASPNGWINDGDNQTFGNNADTFVDRNMDDQPDIPRPTGNPVRTFDFPCDLTLDPTNYMDAAVVQLFFRLNYYHDRLYDLGFTEAAGNYQQDNFGRGGLGNDNIIGYAQAGADLGLANNAFFTPAPDGIHGQIHMFIWNQTSPNRDTDLDADWVMHEATHGTSERLVGGGLALNATQSGGLGEGWSDWTEISMQTLPGDDVNACYSDGGYCTYAPPGMTQNYYFGDRRYPYSTDMTKNPLTYKDIDPTQISAHPGVPLSPTLPFNPAWADEVHMEGEVWCVTLWDVRANLVTKLGGAIGNQTALQIVVDGMKLTPPDPTFLQARDAIIMADRIDNAGANFAGIWRGFAKRGMGASATSPSSDTTLGLVEAYDMPGLAVETVAVLGGNGNGVIDVNECNELLIGLVNISDVTATRVSARLSTTTPGAAVVQPFSPYPNIPSSTTANNLLLFKVSTSPDFVCGTPIDFRLLVKSDQDTRTNLFRLKTGTLGAPVRFDNNVAVPIPDANAIGLYSPITVSGIAGAVGKITVSLHITHTFDSDLTLQLVSPDGKTNTLAASVGGSGDNFGKSCSPESDRTTFDDDATNAIGTANAPFAGAFTPDQPLAVFMGKYGTNANGTWLLHVVDAFRFDVGTLQCWSLLVSPSVCADGGGECPGVDLALGMTDNPDPVVTGSNLVYTITVTNNGPNVAKGVIVSQTIPAGAIYVSGAASQGTVTPAGATINADLGTLVVGGTATIQVTLLPTIAGSVSSTATVSSKDTDFDLSNNTVTVLTTVLPPSSDMGVGLVSVPDPAVVGGTLTYVVSVTNNGPAAASGIVLSNALPVSVFVNGVDASQGTASIAGNIVLVNLGGLTKGGWATVSVNVTPLAFGTINATASVSANQPDPLPVNNVATVATVVAPSADMGLSIVDSPDPVVLRSNLTYLITVTNRGPNAATNVVVNQSLPRNLTVASVTPSQGTYTRNGSSVLYNLGGISAGASATIRIVGNSPNLGTLVTTATITSGQNDPHPADNSATASTLVALPFVSIVPAGATLKSESVAPPDGAIEPGETLTVDLRLRNAGNVNNTNLVVTLLATNGVTAPSGPQSYGVLPAAGLPVSRPFTFTASGTNGGAVMATLQLQDGPNNLGLATFVFPMPNVAVFANTNAILIPDVGVADPYPSKITVSGLTGLVSKVTATLNGFGHSYPHDVNAQVAGPSGDGTVLMAHAGGVPVANLTLTFDDSAALALSNLGQLLSGAYQPTAYEGVAAFPAPAPTAAFGTAFSVFNGLNPNGKWALFVLDDSTGDEGQIANGWSLAITTVTPVNRIADLGLTGNAAPAPALVGGTLAYTFLVTNSGPNAASAVAFTNVLPASVQLVSAGSSQGTVSTNGATVAGNLGNLDAGASATVTIVVEPAAAGAVSSSATVTASEVDLNPNNNAATVVSTVNLPLADLALTKAGPTNASIVGSNLTYTLTVTNAGPDTALGVVVTDPLPASVTFVSAVTSVGTATNLGGTVTCSIGNLPAGAGAEIALVVVPLGAGLLPNAAVASTLSTDTIPDNNVAAAVTPVANPAVQIVPAGTKLVSESLVPPNGAIEVGETVTVLFSLADTGQLPTANLVATLLATGGVNSPSGPQTYGALAPGGSAVAQPFTFTASGGTGGEVSATLHLTDGANDLGTAVFGFRQPTGGTFSNAAFILIPDHGAAVPYPSTIGVSGLTGLVSQVTVTLGHVNHSFPDDIDALLVGPTGRKLVLLSRAGGGHVLTNVNLTFSDGATDFLPRATQIVSGTYKPTSYAPSGGYPPPAPAGMVSTTLSAFNGTDPNGAWSLYVNDHSVGDGGNIAIGWSLAITAVNPVNPVADVSVAADHAPDPVFADSPLTLSVTVTNRGPADATGVTVTDTLPAGVNFISATASQGTCTNVGGIVTCNLGNLPLDGVATITIVVTPTGAGPATNLVTVAANEYDLNPEDNAAQTVATVLNVAPARLTGEYSTAAGVFQLLLSGQSGQTYIIQTSTNLMDWANVLTNVAALNGTVKYTDPTASNAVHRFYRGLRVP